MLESVAAAIQSSALSATLRSSLWLYPLVNTGHVLGIALLFGAIVPLDLRLIGWRRTALPLDGVARLLLPVAVAGLLLALATGALLFATRPLDYVVEPLFGIKMALLLGAVANALWLRRAPAWRLLDVRPVGRSDGRPGAPPTVGWRVAGALSLLLWLGVITAGRLIGYR